MSDELIEAMARVLCDDTLKRWRSPIGVQPEPWREFIPAARALLPIIRAHLEPTSEMVEAACRVRPASHMWPDRYTDSLQAFERKFAKAAIIAALAASPIGDVG